MMNKIVLTIAFCLFSLISFSQKMYIWCPDELEAVAQTEKLNNEKVFLNIQDSRLLTKNRKEKCSSKELVLSISDLIKSTYPNADFVAEDKNPDFKINIQLTAYYSEFHTAAWKGKTEMNLEFIDLKNNNTQSTEISQSKANGNFGGMRTAKNNLKKSYNKAMIDLLAMLNQLLD